MKKIGSSRKAQAGTLFVVIVGAILVALVIGGITMFFVNKNNALFTQEDVLEELEQKKEEGTGAAGCSQNPAYTYSAVDKFSTNGVTGTDRIKLNAQKPVTSLANPAVGESLQYWLENSTNFCEIVNEPTVKCGSQLVQSDCYKNLSSVSVKVRDDDNEVFLSDGTGGANNLSIAAKATANLNLRYQGVADEAGMPFGGCVAVEYPNNITTVTISGEGLSTSKLCPYVWTYVVSDLANTFKLFEVPVGFDKDALGDLKKISLQLTAGDSAPAGQAYVRWMPAKHYITNAGEFVLGIEKDKNGDTTKTMGQLADFSFTVENI